MPKLTSKEIDQLLSTAIIARLAMVKKDGSPYVVPLWQYWDGQSMYLILRAKSQFVQYLKDEPRVAVSCAEDSHVGHRRVLIEGLAEIMEGPVLMAGVMFKIAAEMAERYGQESGLKYLDSTMNKPRYLVRVMPKKIASWIGDWHPRYE